MIDINDTLRTLHFVEIIYNKVFAACQRKLTYYPSENSDSSVPNEKPPLCVEWLGLQKLHKNYLDLISINVIAPHFS